MFTAKAHSLLVPYDGSFNARNAPTLPEQDDRKSEHWKDLLEAEAKALGDAQYRLYADGSHAVLIVFQALDAAGKDGTIRHVFAGVNPCGLHVTPFKRRSARRSRTTSCGARAHLPGAARRGVQPQLLRRSARRARASAVPRPRSGSPEKPSPAFWAERASRDRRARAPSRGAGHGDPQVLAQHLEERAAQAPARAHRRSRSSTGNSTPAISTSATAVERLPRGLPRLPQRHVTAVGAVVRDSGRRQTLRALAGRQTRERRLRAARPRLPERPDAAAAATLAHAKHVSSRRDRARRIANSVTLTSWMGRYDAAMSIANLQSLAYEIDSDFRVRCSRASRCFAASTPTRSPTCCRAAAASTSPRATCCCRRNARTAASTWC